MKKYIMSIDQGTTGTTVIIIDQVGGLVASSDFDFKQIYPQPGWVEHNPEDIWQSVKFSALDAIKKAKLKPSDILTLGITNQRETVVAWRKSNSKVLHNAIVWQCRRTHEMCRKLKPKWEKYIIQKTGLLLDPYFSGTKIRWLMENSQEVQKAYQENDLAFGTVDTFLLWKLTDGQSYMTDVSNASRMLMMDLKTLKWDKTLVKLFKINKNCLPEIKSTADFFGYAKKCHFLSNKTSINALVGDQQAALFGQTCFDAGDIKCTFGTGSFILMNTGSRIIRSKNRLLTTVAWKIKNNPAQYALEGGAFICGAAVTWLCDGLGLIKSSSEIESLANSVKTTEGVEFVPALTGLSAPYWNPTATGLITGLTRGSTSGHIARATLEAMALQNTEILKIMNKDSKKKTKLIRVDGRASDNNLLMQLQSDYTQTKVARPQQIESTAFGAAYLAGLSYGIWKNLNQIKLLSKIDKQFYPKMSKKELSLRFLNWSKAVSKVQT